MTELSDQDIMDAVVYSVALNAPMPLKIRQMTRPMLEHAFRAMLHQLQETKRQHGHHIPVQSF
jgi:hypothetical protein